MPRRETKGRSERATGYRRWYSLARWKRLRRRKLQEHPLCLYCLRENMITAAVALDHIVPHGGDPVLFWDESNLAQLCTYHHDLTKRREEMGLVQAVDEDGWVI